MRFNNIRPRLKETPLRRPTSKFRPGDVRSHRFDVNLNDVKPVAALCHYTEHTIQSWIQYSLRGITYPSRSTCRPTSSVRLNTHHSRHPVQNACVVACTGHATLVATAAICHCECATQRPPSLVRGGASACDGGVSACDGTSGTRVALLASEATKPGEDEHATSVGDWTPPASCAAARP